MRIAYAIKKENIGYPQNHINTYAHTYILYIYLQTTRHFFLEIKSNDTSILRRCRSQPHGYFRTSVDVRWRCNFSLVCRRVQPPFTLSCASAKINQNQNVIAERRACEFARVREHPRREYAVPSRSLTVFDFAFLWPRGQFLFVSPRNNVTYTTADHVDLWIKEGSWLPAIRCF